MTYKKGTKIKLWCCTHDAQSMEDEIITLDADCTAEELEAMAEDFYQCTKEPEYGFELVEDENE